MYEMRVDEERTDGLMPVWHVVGKNPPVTLCGRAAPTGVPAAGQFEETEHYCAPCMEAFGQAMAAARPA